MKRLLVFCAFFLSIGCGEFLPKGERGRPGPAGPQGEVGPEGNDGDRGPQGPVGPQGPQGGAGSEGPMGPSGPEGPMGPQGPDGGATMPEVEICNWDEDNGYFTATQDYLTAMNTLKTVEKSYLGACTCEGLQCDEQDPCDEWPYCQIEQKGEK